MNLYFEKKRVLVTGGANGIGRALVIKLHEYGAEVFTIDKDEAGLESLKNKCPGIKTLHVDLTKWSPTKAAVESILPLDLLVNNAAVNNFEAFFNITPESIKSCYNVNLEAVVNVSQVFAKDIIQKGSKGSIVNISAIGAKMGNPSCGIYASSKAALNSLSMTMATELGPNIRVNVVTLGLVKTELLMGYRGVLAEHKGIQVSKLEEEWRTRSPLKQLFIDMDQCTEIILFVLSDKTPSMTGSDISLDAGMLIN